MNKKLKFESICLHGGQEPDPVTLSRALPIYRTSSYVFKNTEHAANLFGLKELGNIYTRLMNPTTAALEERVAQMENGAAGLALASGTSGIFYTIINLCKAGDEIISANNLYGGTYTMFHDILAQFNIKVHLIDPTKPENFRKYLNNKTKLLFCESVSNPGLDVTDIGAVADIAHENGLPLVVDSTFSTPYLQRPLDQGADIVVHSLTKWLGGHGTGIGGIVIDSGKFDWTSGKFPLMSDPEPSYHGIRWAYDLPEPLKPVAFLLRMRLIPLRNLGSCISPDNAWFFLQGIETLHLRMERHCKNAHKVAEFLSKHPKVKWVRFPGLPNDPNYQLCKKYLDGHGGSMVVFGCEGGLEEGVKFIEKLKLFSHLANVGDAKSLAIHPASTTHSQLTEEQQIASGIRPELVRLSVGIENSEDILHDIDQALS